MTEKEEVKKEVKAPKEDVFDPKKEGAVKTGDIIDLFAEKTSVAMNENSAFVIDPIDRIPPKRTIGKMKDSLILGGVVYVPEILDKKMREEMEERFGKGEKLGGFVLYKKT